MLTYDDPHLKSRMKKIFWTNFFFVSYLRSVKIDIGQELIRANSDNRLAPSSWLLKLNKVRSKKKEN
jgi:hypothetical protein